MPLHQSNDFNQVYNWLNNKLIAIKCFTPHTTPIPFPYRLRGLFINYDQKYLLSWEALLNKNDLDKYSLRMAMKALINYYNKILTHKIIYTIYFIPFGLEDEGYILDEFLSQTYKFKLCAVLWEPLDFIDLRINSKLIV